MPEKSEKKTKKKFVKQRRAISSEERSLNQFMDPGYTVEKKEVSWEEAPLLDYIKEQRTV